jgi:hypothetical protein
MDGWGDLGVDWIPRQAEYDVTCTRPRFSLVPAGVRRESAERRAAASVIPTKAAFSVATGRAR